MKKTLFTLLLVLSVISCAKFDNAILDGITIDGISRDSSSVVIIQPRMTKITLPNDIVIGKIGDQYYWGDDMLISQEQVDYLAGLSKDETRGNVDLGYRWPNAKIPYVQSHLFSETMQQRIADAMAIIEQQTRFDFVRRDGEYDRVNIEPTTGNSRAHVGRQGGKQYIYLNQSASVGTIIHEMGHMLGLWHEHQRSDRDDYLTLTSSQLADGINYGIQGEKFGPFDFNSIMLYSGITRRDNPSMRTIVNRDKFSAGDLKALYNRYGYPESELQIISPTITMTFDDGQPIDAVRYTNTPYNVTITFSDPDYVMHDHHGSYEIELKREIRAFGFMSTYISMGTIQSFSNRLTIPPVSGLTYKFIVSLGGYSQEYYIGFRNR